MAGLHDFQQGSHCHRKTWINILLGILQLLSPCIQHGRAQLQGECSPFICRFFFGGFLPSRQRGRLKKEGKAKGGKKTELGWLDTPR